MPQADFTDEFRGETRSRTENLFKLRVGESARIVMLEKPTYAYVHQLRAPKIVNGQAVREEKKRKGKDGGDGETYVDYVYDFIGRPLCLGDFGTIKDKGTDEKHCPACKAALEGGEVPRPECRYAVNIIRYNTKPDMSLVNPFGCVAEVWAFTAGIFDKLYNLAKEHGELLGRDLLLGPCEPPEHYQRLKALTVGARDVWKLDQVRNTVVETFKQNRQTDLETRAIGRPVEFRYMVRDIENIAERWRQANGQGTSIIPVDQFGGIGGVGAPSLTEGLSELLNTTQPATPNGNGGTGTATPDLNDLLGTGPATPAATITPATPAPAASVGVDFSDLLGDGSPLTEPAAVPATVTPAASVETTDFDQLLKSLG